MKTDLIVRSLLEKRFNFVASNPDIYEKTGDMFEAVNKLYGCDFTV